MDSITQVTTAATAPTFWVAPVFATYSAGSSTEASLASADQGSLSSARLEMIVQLIRNMTGREVKLVPPTAYLVSPPAQLPVVVDLAVPPDLLAQQRAASGPLVVDISAALRDGFAQHMKLTAQGGGVALSAALDVPL